MKAAVSAEVMRPASSFPREEIPSHLTLYRFLAARAVAMPDAPALRDQDSRSRWGGGSPGVRSYRDCLVIVDRLAARLAALNLPAGSVVGVQLPCCIEACLILPALERAGHIPCLLPMSLEQELVASAVERCNIVAVVGITQIEGLRPAERLRDIAAGYFGLRFLLAFGPDAPDGIISLDECLSGNDAPTSDIAWNASLGTQTADSAHETGYISLDVQTTGPVPFFRSWSSALDAARVFLRAGRYGETDRIITLLAQDDHRSLTTGFVACLVSGAMLECHGLFDRNDLGESLARPGRIRLVAPGWLEASLAGLELPHNILSVILVHEAPVRFRARSPLTHGVVDALGFGELALVAQARDSRGRFALSLDESPPGEGATTPLLFARRMADGAIQFSGPACRIHAFSREGAAPPAAGWRDSGFSAEVFAGILIGVGRTKA